MGKGLRLGLYARKYSTYIIVLLVAVLAYYLYNDYVMKNTDSFETFDENKIKIMLFSASFCGFCKEFAPTWEELKEKIKKDKSLKDRVIITAYSDEDKEAMKYHHIKSFPTIILKDKDGTYHTFDKDRSLENLMTFINEYL